MTWSGGTIIFAVFGTQFPLSKLSETAVATGAKGKREGRGGEDVRRDCNERARATPLVRVSNAVGNVFLGRRTADGRVGRIPKVPVEGH